MLRFRCPIPIWSRLSLFKRGQLLAICCTSTIIIIMIAAATTSLALNIIIITTVLRVLLTQAWTQIRLPAV